MPPPADSVHSSLSTGWRILIHPVRGLCCTRQTPDRAEDDRGGRSMATASPDAAGTTRRSVSTPRRGSALEVAEYFAPQRTGTDALPAPEPLLKNLTIGVLEALAGVREVDQLARWFGEDAFRALITRANLSARARSARGVAPARPVHHILSTRHSSPADGVIEEWSSWQDRRAPAPSPSAWRAGTGAGAPRPSRFSDHPPKAGSARSPIPTGGTRRGSCRAVRSPR